MQLERIRPNCQRRPPIKALALRAGAQISETGDFPKLAPRPQSSILCESVLDPNQLKGPQGYRSSGAFVLFQARQAFRWHDSAQSADAAECLAQHMLRNTTYEQTLRYWAARPGSAATKCAKSPRAWPQSAQHHPS